MQAVQTPLLAVHPDASRAPAVTAVQTPSMGAYPSSHASQYFEPPTSRVQSSVLQWVMKAPVHSLIQVPFVVSAPLLSTWPG